ncbi:MAG TPA: polysaccharide biosynthesis tyrosine autokinase [Candidatus Limnocylindrales bacterium]|nr:polysaccharide biosynthesis tyrosine autokinase [Candidatus Limnocylindrales bacterium]
MNGETQIRPYEPPGPPALKTLEFASYRGAERIKDVPDIVEYWRVIQKRRGTILTTLFIVFTLALVATLKEKPVYEAQALIEIQKENPDIPSLQELFQVESISDTYLETQNRILKSESLARRVIMQLRLDQVAEFGATHKQEAAAATTDAPGEQVFAVAGTSPSDADVPDEVLKKFKDRLSIEPVKRSRLIEVSFDSNNPKLAADVVNTLTAAYIQGNLEARWDASQEASDWLAQQLQSMKAKLEKSEDDLQKYAQDNGLLFLETDKGTTENIVVQRLRELQEQLTQAQADRFEKESLFHLLQNGDYASLPSVFDNKLLQDLSEKLAELQQERSRLISTFTPDYPRVKEIQSQIDETQANLDAERERGAKRIANDYEAAVGRESMLQQAFQEQQKQADEIAAKSVQYNILKREADTNKQLYVGLLEKLKETGISTSLKATNIRVVDPAHPPKKPARPRILLNLSLAALLGLCLGTGVAFFQEHLDNTLKTTEDVERFLQLPALGAVPAVNGLSHGKGVHALYDRARLLAGDGHRSNGDAHWNRIEGEGLNGPLAEAFHSLRTSVLLSTAKRPPSSLLVTSAQAGEGKTTVAANLALSLAQLGESVLLIDADLRRPKLQDFFGTENSAGLVDFLTGRAGWRKLVWQAPAEGLSVLFCGPVPPNPADLLSSEYMPNLVREASKEYKFVVLDSPPMLNLADSRILATLVDGVILVIGGGTTPRELVHRAYASAIDAGSHVLGATINFADARNDYYSDYGAKSNGNGK